ncbi:hypothetical protein C7T94_03850 [Pedobacter yulinensis]|uniref:Uncharacterized protein n=1 Tax=Pedobacter yulinensis TaxID=2126353 RepID=A0A2T3HN86_9SPHI|nr:hypothetical protein [Pedobacter yulinensis]PST83889.1 hypothetical protein C7T94_03850 [Pedobacter yulinensis]
MRKFSILLLLAIGMMPAIAHRKSILINSSIEIFRQIDVEIALAKNCIIMLAIKKQVLTKIW